MLLHISNWLLFSSPARSQREFFLYIHCENLVKLLEIKLTQVWGSLDDWPPQEFLSLRFVHMQPPEIHQLQFRFSYPATGSHWGFCLWVSALISHDSLDLSVYLSFQFAGQWFARWPPFSDGSKKNCWFFSFFSFLLPKLFFKSDCIIFIFTKSLWEFQFLYMLTTRGMVHLFNFSHPNRWVVVFHCCFYLSFPND